MTKPELTPQEEVIREVARYCGCNSQRESGFLTPDPQYTVDPMGLCAMLKRKFGVTDEQLNKWSGE